jgi:hypothetical protein
MGEFDKAPDPPEHGQWELDEELSGKLDMGPLGEGQELSDDEEGDLVLEDVISIPEDRAREEMPSRDRFARPADPGEITKLEADLTAATDREQVAATAVRIAACYARAAAIFVVNDDTIAGLCAEGEGLAERIEGVLISSETPGLFGAPLAEGTAYRQVPSESPDDVRLMRALGRSDACDVLVVPVRVRDRIVNLLYADNGPDRLAETSVGALVTLGTCLAHVYERLIATH